MKKVCRIENTVVYLYQQNSKTMTNLKTKLGLRKNIDQFSNRDAAFRWANNCIKLHVVMLGDNENFWVACFADAQKLSKMGYEIAK